MLKPVAAPPSSRRTVSRRALLTGLAGASLLLASPPRSAQAQQPSVAVFADPVLKEPLTALIPTLRKPNGARDSLGASLMVAFGDVSGATGVTGTLIHDVIIVAGAGNMARLVGKGLVEQPTALVGDTLALVAAPDRPGPAALTRGMDLTEWVDRRHPLAVIDPDRNALGDVSLQALRMIGWGDGISRRVSLAPAPATVLDWVAHGEAALGVTLATLARQDPRVRLVGAFPPDLCPPVQVQVAVRAGTPVDAPARRVVQALYSPTARQAYQAAGLTPLVPR